MSKELEHLLARLDFAAQDWDTEGLEEVAAQLIAHLNESEPGDPERFVRQLREATRAAARAWDVESARALTGRLHNYLREAVPTNPTEFVCALGHAIDRFDRPRVAALCEGLVSQVWASPDPYPLGPAQQILGTLRRKRYFDLMTEVAEAMMQTGRDEARVRRQYAQALLDRGQSIAALVVLEDLRARCETELSGLTKGSDEHKHANGERIEAIGLIGRAHKQIYMDAAKRGGENHRAEHLRDAVQAYAIPFQEDRERNLWHGINTVALLRRAERDEVVIKPPPIDVRATAEQVNAQIATKEKANLWDYATAAEASLALGDYEAALVWINKYTDAKGADAFEYASTLRQFEEVWKLSDDVQEEANILVALRAALLERQGGSVSLDNPAKELESAARYLAEPIDDGEDGGSGTHERAASGGGMKGQFEKTFGSDRYKSLKWYMKGVSQARAVAKIEDRAGNGQGTGFLLAGNKVHPSISEEWVMLTNAHVISVDSAERAENPPSLPPDEVQVRFCGSDDPEQVFEVGRILFSSGRHELDCTIVTLQSPVPFEHHYNVPKGLPIVGNQRIYVIGHPKGGQLSFSLHDNDLLDHEAPRIHYRSPTEGGSSGSPIFNSAWGLIGLHHFGGTEMKRLNGKAGTYAANEGMWIHSVLQAVARELD